MKWLDKYNNGGVQPNYNDANVSLPPNFKGYGYNKSGNSKNGSWDGPVTRMGGMLPGATGMMYSNNFQVNEKKPNTKKYQEGGVERKLPLTPLYSPLTNNSNSFDFGDSNTRPFKTNIPDEEYDRRKTQSVLEKTFGKDFHVLNYLPNQNLQSESDKYPLQTFIRYNLGISNEPEYLPFEKPPIKEVQDIRGQYLKADPFGPAGPENSKVDFEKAVKDKGARQFLERYNDPVTRKRLKEQAGMTDYDIDNFIIRGLTAKKTVTNNFRWDAEAMYDGDKHEILIRPNKSNAVETHERVHASALDNVMGKALSKIVGNAFLQKESNNFTIIKDYMNRPHETYGNFSEFRERLGLKPGEQINIKELERRVKKLGLERDHFYDTYDKDKVLKALNTIALNDNLPIQNIAQRGKTIPFKDPDHPFTDKNLFEQFGVLPILETPILESTDRNLTIKDPRKILATSQKPIRPNFDNVSGNYNSYHLDELINEAKKSGMSKDDIWNLTAMAFQETKWGKTDENIGHVLGNFTNAENDYQNFINAYKVKQKEANRLGYTSPEMRLQMYNGMGVIKPETEEDYHGFKMKKIYGVDVPPEGISMKKNPLYGKQIIDIRDNVLKNNPGFVKYMDSIQKAPIMFGSDYIKPLHPEELPVPKFQEGGEKTSWSNYINPWNWGVTNRDDDGTKSQAYRAAKMAGEDEFMWHGTRYTTEYAGTPRQEVGAYGIKGKSVNDKYPVQVNRYDAFDEYFPGHISAGYVGRSPKPSVRTSVNKTSTGKNKKTDYDPDQALYVYDAELDTKNVKPGYNLINNNCADGVCDALSINDRSIIETPTGVVEKLLSNKQYPSLDVTGRTYKDYLRALQNERDILDNSNYWLGIASSPDNKNLSKKIVSKIQKTLSNKGYQLSKSKSKQDNYDYGFDGIYGEETNKALDDWKKKNKSLATGGSIPGSVGFTYARTNDPAPSNGPYAKKTMASAKDGAWLDQYDVAQNGKWLGGGVIKDDLGQWAHPGEITEIGSNQITMQGVPYPVLGISDTGDKKMMQPGKDYKFKGNSVTEYPMAQEGAGVNKEGVKQYKWFKNYMRSPKYKERLKKEFPDYNDRQIEQESKSRLQNVMQTRVGFLPLSSKYSKNLGSIQGFYDHDAFPGAIMLRPEYSASTSDEIFEPGNYLNGYNTIPLHEWSHAADDGGNKMPQSTTDLMLSKMKENFLDIPKDKYYYTKPTEYLGRMQPLRYLMQQEGLYDAGTQDFTKEDLENAKQNKTIKNNQHFQDLMENVKSDEDFIELMNKVASVNQKDNSRTMIAKDGKSLVELNQLTNFTNYNTPQPGGWLDKY
jgi:hypothetical protein